MREASSCSGRFMAVYQIRQKNRVILSILFSDCVFRVSDEFKVLEIGLELGQVHFLRWKVGDEFVGLPVYDGEIQTGND